MEKSRQNNEPIELLVTDVKNIINNARTKVATLANAGINMTYWQIGERINREVLGNKRAEYGKRIVSTLATQLTWSHIVNQSNNAPLECVIKTKRTRNRAEDIQKIN